MSQIALNSVSKSYGAFHAVKESSFDVRQGEFFSLLGPSGCGKSTTLRMIAGFVSPDNGTIVLAGQDVTRLAPERRGIGIVFQNYAIFPHMTVAQNVAYGLKLRRVPRDRIAERVDRALAQVSLSGFGHRMPAQLSGGQLQRVALARVIVVEPKLLLLDEPLSALDKKLRDEMRVWLKALQAELGITTIYVTHDQDEALSLSDRIAVMNAGVIEQIGAPADIYERPETPFVARFIGDSNILPARLRSVEGGRACLTVADAFEVACSLEAGRGRVAPGENLSLLIRPEKVLLGADAEATETRLRGRILDLSYHGAQTRYRVALPGGEEIVAERQNAGAGPLAPGAETDVGWAAGSARLLPAEASTTTGAGR